MVAVNILLDSVESEAHVLYEYQCVSSDDEEACKSVIE